MLDSRSVDYINLAMYICIYFVCIYSSLLFIYRSAVIVLHMLPRSVTCMHSILRMRMRFD